MKCKVVETNNDLVKCIRLGEAHYNEVEKGFTNIPYEPRIGMFLSLFENGNLQCVALYDGAKIEGYVLVSIAPSLLTKGEVAHEVGVYVNPKYRGQGWFNKMLGMLEERLCKRGVNTLMIAFKNGFKHSLPDGYKESETMFIKVLEK